jgi:uncharacterized protein (TIGR02996 family)
MAFAPLNIPPSTEPSLGMTRLWPGLGPDSLISFLIGTGVPAMHYEEGFLHAIKANPLDDAPRLIYADWLEERDDPRADFIRLHLALMAAAPDHPERVAGEHELSSLRKGCDAAWLAVIEPERASLTDDPSPGRGCRCFYAGWGGRRKRSMPYFHVETQDTESDPWKRLLDLVEEAAADGREEFAPLRGMSPSERSQILTLPSTIARLKAVKALDLYGSYIVSIPPEIGEMSSLEKFVPYTSYRLHWFPYEITRCQNLHDSTVSTRALYGNYKYRPPFPRLHTGAAIAPGRIEPTRLPLKRWRGTATRPCSVCGRPFEDRRLYRVWISLRVATDILPLLVNACSEECLAKLPVPPDRYVKMPHRGGLRVQQPPTEYE